jgi:Thaumatin family
MVVLMMKLHKIGQTIGRQILYIYTAQLIKKLIETDHRYNVGIGITALGKLAKGTKCGYAGCVSDVNARCPPELRVKGRNKTETIACKSACEAFQTAEYWCTGALRPHQVLETLQGRMPFCI